MRFLIKIKETRKVGILTTNKEGRTVGILRVKKGRKSYGNLNNKQIRKNDAEFESKQNGRAMGILTTIKKEERWGFRKTNKEGGIEEKFHVKLKLELKNVNNLPITQC